MKENRGSWYLLTGLLIGIGLGLGFAWFIQPVQYVNTSPASLRTEFKDQYRALIAAAYVANNDIVRARARLELLQDADIFRALSEQAQRYLAQGNAPEEARALGLLAIALGQEAPGPAVVITLPPPTATPTETASPSSTPTLEPTQTSTPTPTEQLALTEALSTSAPEASPTLTPSASPTPRFSSTPTNTPRIPPTFTPTLTRTPTATPGGPFVLLSRQRLCDQAFEKPLLQVQALDARSDPASGVLVTVAWQGGVERFYTGLKPEKGLGYADFTMTPGVLYSLQLGENGEIVVDLSAVSCTGSGGSVFWGAWLLTFTQQ
jgi:hypothetical protein